MYRRKFLGTAGAGAFALASGVAATDFFIVPPPRFRDVPADNLFYTVVKFVTERGLIDGIGDEFQPDANVSRATVVTALYRLAGAPEVKHESVLLDVPAGQWYSNAAIWANNTGLLGEFTSGGRFNPDEAVNREQLAAMIFNYADIKLPEMSDLAAFFDAGDISPWAEAAMGWCISRGILGGILSARGGQQLQHVIMPGEAISRAQFAVSLQQFVQLKEDPKNIWVLNPVPDRTPVEAVPLAPRVQGGWEGKTLAVLANYNSYTATIVREVEKLLPVSVNLVWIGDMTVVAGQTVNPSKPPADKWTIMRYTQEFQPALREGKLKPDAIINGMGF